MREFSIRLPDDIAEWLETISKQSGFNLTQFLSTLLALYRDIWSLGTDNVDSKLNWLSKMIDLYIEHLKKVGTKQNTIKVYKSALIKFKEWVKEYHLS